MALQVSKRGAMTMLMAVTMLLSCVVNAAVYKVGDSVGWTTLGNPDYKQWAASKTFQIGDVIIFEYNTQFHDVMEVTHQSYRDCNITSPLATYTSGNDSITITRHGHHYFLCSRPGHCASGQKVDINVPRDLAAGGPALSPTPASESSPSGRTPASAPSTNAAVSVNVLGSLMCNLGFSVAVLFMVVGRFF